jgi:hypothetical protein
VRHAYEKENGVIGVGLVAFLDSRVRHAYKENGVIGLGLAALPGSRGKHVCRGVGSGRRLSLSFVKV